MSESSIPTHEEQRYVPSFQVLVPVLAEAGGYTFGTVHCAVAVLKDSLSGRAGSMMAPDQFELDPLLLSLADEEGFFKSLGRRRLGLVIGVNVQGT